MKLQNYCIEFNYFCIISKFCDLKLHNFRKYVLFSHSSGKFGLKIPEFRNFYSFFSKFIFWPNLMYKFKIRQNLCNIEFWKFFFSHFQKYELKTQYSQIYFYFLVLLSQSKLNVLEFKKSQDSKPPKFQAL